MKRYVAAYLRRASVSLVEGVTSAERRRLNGLAKREWRRSLGKRWRANAAEGFALFREAMRWLRADARMILRDRVREAQR